MTDFLKPLSCLGMGSVPFEEGVNACEGIFESWDLPFWPQYPRRSPKENLVFQFLSFLPGLRVAKEKASLDETEYLHQSKEYQERLNRAFSRKSFLSFEPPEGWALGFSQMKVLFERGAFPEKRVVKLQVTGPGTAWNSFFSGLALSGTSQIYQDVSGTLTAAGLAQIERVHSYGRRSVIVIDEPVPTENLSGLEAMVSAFRNRGALVGLHVCSPASWEGFERLGLELFHFDLTTRTQLAAADRAFLQKFLKRKNWVAWGVVSTSRAKELPTEDFSGFLLDYLEELSDGELTVKEILKRSLIAPACGTGTLTPAEDRAICQSLQVTSESLKQRSVFD